MAKGLLASDAPLLYKEVQARAGDGGATDLYAKWIHCVCSLATRCCATVEPNVKKGDLLDIRPYVKVKGRLRFKIQSRSQMVILTIFLKS